MRLFFPSSEQWSPRSPPCSLMWFVLGSLLLHVLVVALWRSESPAGPVGQGTFQITLVARHGEAVEMPTSGDERARQSEPGDEIHSAAVSRARSEASGDTRQPLSPVISQRVTSVVNQVQPAEIRQREEARNPAREISQRERSRVTSLHAAAAPSGFPARRGATTDGQHELTSAARSRRVRDELLRALLPHFEYPAVARRRGWEGRVRIGLLVKADGDLNGVHLVESSGHALLDKAAMKNVRQLRKLPGATQWLDGRDMDVVLPVSYRLEDR